MAQNTGQVKITQDIRVLDLDGNVRTYNSTKSYDVTALETKEYAISASSTTIVWNGVATDYTSVGTADFLLFWSNIDLNLELVVDVGAEVGTEYMSLPLEANVWLCLGSNAAFANFTTDVFAGTIDQIEKVRVKETNAAAGTFIMILGT